MLCNLCPRNCNAERNENTGKGFCKMPENPVLARADIHNWEEPCISGENGTGAIFFSGCSLKCCFCQNYPISHENKGEAITTVRLVEIIKELENKGVHTIDFVNPTHFSHIIIDALNEYKPRVPVVYNSSGYDSVETLQKLEGLIDVYLPDLKYFSIEKSTQYAKCPDYFEKASQAILEMHRQQPETEFKDGIIQKGLIIRHLVLPKNIDESKNILLWIKENLPNDTYISIMSQYTPYGDISKFKELNRRLTTAEYNKVVDFFVELGLQNGFMQEKTSSQTKYIPDFDMTGVK
ncbi:MAG: radical SAM protein [Clostridia bacterium]|nr:radical SAM protein [Clostridia bacterium]